jgi:hypothetical protein
VGFEGEFRNVTNDYFYFRVQHLSIGISLSETGEARPPLEEQRRAKLRCFCTDRQIGAESRTFLYHSSQITRDLAEGTPQLSGLTYSFTFG